MRGRGTGVGGVERVAEFEDGFGVGVGGGARAGCGIGMDAGRGRWQGRLEDLVEHGRQIGSFSRGTGDSYVLLGPSLVWFGLGRLEGTCFRVNARTSNRPSIVLL